MLYRATHTTTYQYEAPVSQCLSELRLTPRRLPWQVVLERTVQSSPNPESVDERKDYFGNTVSVLSILERHDRFSTVATSLVRVEERPGRGDQRSTWEEVRDEVSGLRTAEAIDVAEFIFESPFVPIHRDLADLAAPSFPSGVGVLEAVTDLMHRIHRDFTYRARATTIETPVLDVLRTRRGVCQDFSHVMIGALRSMGLPARYVSGYLRSGADHQGAEASHAWVSVYVPGAGWEDFDPTNDVVPGTAHVTLAWGRDYGDVTPVKGVALGGGKQTVDVEVRVEAVGE